MTTPNDHCRNAKVKRRRVTTIEQAVKVAESVGLTVKLGNPPVETYFWRLEGHTTINQVIYVKALEAPGITVRDILHETGHWMAAPRSVRDCQDFGSSCCRDTVRASEEAVANALVSYLTQGTANCWTGKMRRLLWRFRTAHQIRKAIAQ